MGMKLRSIHVVNSDIEKVSLCLSNCQMTDENIHDFETDFYILQSDNVISIYSTYFEENFNIKKFRSWFAGEDCYVLFSDYYEDTYIKIDLFKKYRFLIPLIIQNEVDKSSLQSIFKVSEINSAFSIKENDLTASFSSLEDYLQHFSSLFNIPFNRSLSDIIEDPKVECISFYI